MVFSFIQAKITTSTEEGMGTAWGHRGKQHVRNLERKKEVM
jgi:hypothetical protein